MGEFSRWLAGLGHNVGFICLWGRGRDEATLFGSFGLSSLFRSSNQRNQTNQINQTDQIQRWCGCLGVSWMLTWVLAS